jgi:hypothetical protein
MSHWTPTEIQTFAAELQALAAVIFMFTVAFNAFWHYRVRKQERRYNILRVLLYEWTQGADEARKPTERAGLISPRQIDFFNERLKEMGERWTVSKRKRMVVVPILPG